MVTVAAQPAAGGGPGAGPGVHPDRTQPFNELTRVAIEVSKAWLPLGVACPCASCLTFRFSFAAIALHLSLSGPFALPHSGLRGRSALDQPCLAKWQAVSECTGA